MHNRFGAKDFILYLLVGLALLLLVFSLVQGDRAWKRNEEALARTKAIEEQLGRMGNAVGTLKGQVDQVQRAFEQGINTAPPATTTPTQVARASSPATTTPTQVARASPPATTTATDDSWARPGFPIERQPPMAFTTDPRAYPNMIEGGEITEIWEAQTKTLTPNISTDVYSRRVQELVLQSLADFDPQTLKRTGILAEAWQVDPAGLWLRARLRPGVRFSDGVPLTAEDIRWSFADYIMNEQIEAERTRSIIRDSIAGVTVIDPRTVEFTFKQPLASNVDNALGLSILPKHVYSKLTPAQINKATGLLMGSGPFRLRGFNPDNQWAPPADIVLERNEQYWGPRPTLDTIRYQAINDEIGRINTFAKGDADIITPSSPQFASKSADPAWEERATFLKWVNMRSGYSFIAWNGGERNGKLTPFHDPRVRLAMTHALDREKIIRDIYSGIGVVAKGNQPLASPGSNPDIKPWPYDPDRAMALFKEAGWEARGSDGILKDKFGNEFKFQFTYSGGSEISDRIAKFIKDAYTQAGIRVELRPVEWAVYTDLLKTRDFDAITLAWGANAPESDPKQIFHSESIKNQGDNFAQWSNPKADALIDAGRREMDTDKRMAIWRELELVLHQEQPYTFLRVSPWLRFVGPRAGNVVPYPKGLEPVEHVRTRESTPNPGM